MKKFIIILLSVLLLFSCATSEKTVTEVETIGKESALEQSSVMNQTEDEKPETDTLPSPADTETSEEEKSEPSALENKEALPDSKEKTETEETAESFPVSEEEAEAALSDTEEKIALTGEEEVSEHVESEERIEIIEKVDTPDREDTVTAIAYTGTGSVTEAFNYAFGVKNMNDLLSSGIPFVTSYFMRGMYDASLDEKTPLYTTLGKLQSIIENFYWKYTTQDIEWKEGERPESIESLTSLAAPETELELFSYAYGFSVIRDLLSNDVDIEIIPFMAGMLDALYSPSSPLTDEEIETAYNTYIVYLNEEYYRETAEKAETNKEKAEVFLEKNREEEGVTVLENGVQILVLAQDETLGSRPTQYDTVILDYNEYVLDYETGELSFTDADWGAEISVINLSPGFQSAVTNMHVGEAVRAFIPPELTGMAGGDGEEIEPNSIFVYDIALQQIL